jgi:GWxTD domain-containing protein
VEDRQDCLSSTQAYDLPVRSAILLALLLTTSPDVAKWADSPEAYFLTREERREWDTLQSETDRQRFIETFRARRGADFVAEVQRRVVLVDENLALGEAKASTTLRGRIAILLGAPAEVRMKHKPTATTGNVGHPIDRRKGGAVDGLARPNAIGNGAGWVEYIYRYDPNPNLGIPDGGFTIAIEANAASGKDRLKSSRDRKKLDDLLDAAARRSILAR